MKRITKAADQSLVESVCSADSSSKQWKVHNAELDAIVEMMFDRTARSHHLDRYTIKYSEKKNLLSLSLLPILFLCTSHRNT